MITVTTVSGARQEVLDLPEGTTLNALRANTSYRLRCGFSEASTALVDGDPMPGDYVLEDGDEIVFERQAASKA